MPSFSQLVVALSLGSVAIDAFKPMSTAPRRVQRTSPVTMMAKGKIRAAIKEKIQPSSGAVAVKPLTEKDVKACQDGWANAIATISAEYLKDGDFVGAAGTAAGELYGYGHHDMLFKPTKATKNPFRPSGESAMSYFVGADNFPGSEKYKGEDAGFAINGGKGWKDVKFTNHQIDLNGGTALAMGSYDFTCATTGGISTVEYTFGYKRCADGKPRIYLHHSSVPYSPDGAPAPVAPPATSDNNGAGLVGLLVGGLIGAAIEAGM